jgi:hypothetical protein
VAFASRPAGPDSQCKSVPTAVGQDAIGIFLISVTLRSQGPVVLNARLRLPGHDNSDKLARGKEAGPITLVPRTRKNRGSLLRQSGLAEPFRTYAGKLGRNGDPPDWFLTYRSSSRAQKPAVAGVAHMPHGCDRDGHRRRVCSGAWRCSGGFRPVTGPPIRQPERSTPAVN